MESYIQISKINDFLFCPRSLYLHSIYESFHTAVYHGEFQTRGKMVHKVIDNKTYSTLQRYISGLSVTSEKYQITGKIDIYDKDTRALIERKRKQTRIFQGQIYQLYAQKICMEEMGYEVSKLVIHSLADNKTYDVPLPSQDELDTFFHVLDSMKNFDISSYHWESQNPKKCLQCIYLSLCHKGNITV
jgi:CRISPR-associated protein Cas4